MAVLKAAPVDSSGHGGQTQDLDGDEDDGMDEVIYPVDFKRAGHIVDDESGAISSRLVCCAITDALVSVYVKVVGPS